MVLCIWSSGSLTEDLLLELFANGKCANLIICTLSYIPCLLVDILFLSCMVHSIPIHLSLIPDIYTITPLAPFLQLFGIFFFWNLPYFLQGSWIVRQSVGSTPCLLGKAVDCNYIRGPDYLEVIINLRIIEHLYM